MISLRILTGYIICQWVQYIEGQKGQEAQHVFSTGSMPANLAPYQCTGFASVELSSSLITKTVGQLLLNGQ